MLFRSLSEDKRAQYYTMLRSVGLLRASRRCKSLSSSFPLPSSLASSSSGTLVPRSSFSSSLPSAPARSFSRTRPRNEKKRTPKSKSSFTMENWTGNELFRPAVSGEQRLRARSPFALTNMASIRVKHKDANGKPIILDDAGSMLAPGSSSGEALARGASEAVVRVVQRDHLGRSAAVGRRKEASAQVFIRKGSGEFIVNRVPFTEYFLSWEERMQFVVPFQVTDTLGAFDVWTLVQGGGKKGQAEAIRLGIARALQKFDPQYRKALKKNLLLRRDPRVVERQKPGQKGARKKFQWVKR